MRKDAQANRDRILSAAEAAFGDAGPELSTEEVARRAGVGVATVFRHFPTKRDLLEAALIRHFTELEARIERAASEEPPGPALRRVVEEMVTGGSVKIALVTEVTREDGVLRGGAAAASRRVRARLGDLLSEAQEVGAVRSDLDVDAVYHLVRGLSGAGSGAPAPRAALDVVLDGLDPRL